MHVVQDSYETGIPTQFSAVRIFQDEWVCAVPGAGVGTVPLFQDARVQWAIEKAGGVAGKRILELGPLEGAHTYMLSQAGATSVLGLEANTRCFLKTLL
ncbi:hypothetical protein [Mesorhizobium sp. B1-1-8]|uniref:hypothetical protein n=1 Tax=Mesorhizobium sp. B1-1-8 TaxID=2589976 RepID=UPI00112CF779|nr:hypothetical protein [Mesorhizobium sp. B1-1-8]UCI10438.1 hypothetical protein FJ974_29450 [Mesorhizobium sp. B1-1-8]